jgi:Tol biopolymer transport system component
VDGWFGGGRYLAYSPADFNTGSQLRIYDFETESLREIPLKLKPAYWLCPSPDGRRFATSRMASQEDSEIEGIGIFEIDAESGETRLLREGEVMQPKWFPDGKSILFCEFVDKIDFNGGRIVMREVESGAETELARAVSSPDIAAGAFRIALSVDGHKVAFSTYDSELRNWVLKVLEIGNPPARTIHRLRPGDDYNLGLEWTPDGKHVVASGQALYLIAADGSGAREVHLETTGGCYLAKIHPDGCRIAFCAPSQSNSRTYEVRVLENFLPAAYLTEETPGP